MIRRNALTGQKDVQLLLPGISSSGSQYIFYDSASRQYWVVALKKLWILDVRQKTAVQVERSTHQALYDQIYKDGELIGASIFLDSDRNLWAGTWTNEYLRYNLTSGELKHYFLKKRTRPGNGYSPQHTFVSNFHVDRQKQLWIATYGAGLLKYNKTKDDFDFVLADENDRQGLWYNYQIYCLFQDSQNNTWVSTDMGISIVNPYRRDFTVLGYKQNEPNFLPSGEIESVLQMRNGDLWVGTWGGGAAVYDSAYQFKKRYVFDDGNSNLIWSFVEDDQNRVWIGCQGGIINRLDQKTQRFDKPFSIPGYSSTIRCMARDTVGNIYFGLQNGAIAKWDEHTDDFTVTHTPKLNGDGPSPIFDLYIDNQKNLWLNNARYLYRYSTETMTCIDSFLLTEHFDPVRLAFPIGFAPYNDSVFLISSLNGKPGFLNIRSRVFTGWPVGDGIIRQRISAVKRDNTGKIWFTAGWGLYQLNPYDNSNIYNFIPENEIISSVFQNIKATDLAGGKWAFFTNKEVIIFDPVQLAGIDLPKKKPVITGVKVLDNHFPADSAIENNVPVVLSYKQNFLTIDFSPLIFSPVRETKYVYKLLGANQNWTPADNRFSATYTDLKPGSYTFLIKPADDTGNAYTSSFLFVIRPPFWQRWWFYGFCILLSAGLISMLIKRRIGNIRREATLRQKILETEMAALRAQMNPHFIFNCISAIDNLIQNDEREKATTYLARFARLIRNVLDSSKNMIVPFDKDFETTKLFIDLERFRSSDGFDYQLVADDELLSGDYQVPPLLLQPFIENAIHHGLANKLRDKKFLNVNIQLEDNFIVYTITDNGVGRQRAEELKMLNRPHHQSYGIRISKERLENFNRTHTEVPGHNDCLVITDLFDNYEPAGTQVQLKLKIHPHP